MAPVIVPDPDVGAVDGEVPGPGGIFTGKQDSMQLKGFMKKGSNTDLRPIGDESPAVGERHQSKRTERAAEEA
ncbi:hypothetical protein GJ744_009650 [Endocarpon pusillum]|uniref:Uncharacterized protein n=1 Tax=Endocarpon pusillum TaxID=364733 RepID=A0A8H7AFB9_9EURO|nr:hypothetical protein GJ744_009650 [Endocarpon pusillum]